MLLKMNGVYTFVREFYNTSEKHGQHRCRNCKHIFEVGEKFVTLPTSLKRYFAYCSSFCLPCVMKILMKDEDRINEELDRAERRGTVAKIG